MRAAALMMLICAAMSALSVSRLLLHADAASLLIFLRFIRHAAA